MKCKKPLGKSGRVCDFEYETYEELTAHEVHRHNFWL